MTKQELEAIVERATAPTSLGYAYTHYREDILALVKAWRDENERCAKAAEGHPGGWECGCPEEIAKLIRELP